MKKLLLFAFVICSSIAWSQPELNEIKALFDAGNQREAYVKASDFILANPANIDAYELRLTISEATGNESMMLSDIDWLIANNSSKNDLYFYKRGMFNKSKNASMAISDFSKSIGINSSYWESYFERALLYQLNTTTIDKAIADYTTYINANVFSRKYVALVYRGKIYQQKEKYKEALADMNLSATINPMNKDVYMARGILKIEMGNEGCSDLLKYQNMGGKESEKYISEYCN